jgi:hypothetical protein
MQYLCFYHFPLVRSFSGNAVHLLLPFSSSRSIFGQCSTSAFTVFLWSVHFRAMQPLCFYHFPLVDPFSGNAVPLLFPFSFCRSIFGQCSTSAFTVFLWSVHFRAMQYRCFYRFPLVRPFRAMQYICFYHFPLVRPFSGNAAPLLLPFGLFSGNEAPLLFPFSSGPIILGQCNASAFTIFLWSIHFRAMQFLCFYHFPLVRSFSGNAAPCKLLVWVLSYKKNQHSLLVLPILTKPFSCMLLHI